MTRTAVPSISPAMSAALDKLVSDRDPDERAIVRHVMIDLIVSERLPPALETALLQNLDDPSPAIEPNTKSFLPMPQMSFTFICPGVWLPSETTIQVKIEYGVLYVKPGGHGAFPDMRIIEQRKDYIQAILSGDFCNRIIASLGERQWNLDNIFQISSPAAHNWCAIDPHPLGKPDEDIAIAIARAETLWTPYVRIRVIDR